MAGSVQTLDRLPLVDKETGDFTVVLEQKDQGEPWEHNDRFFAVATHAHTHQALKKLDDLRPHLLPEIESFFTHYAGLNGKRLRIVRCSGPRRARKLLKAGAKAFKAKR
jgi:inorganic pyrophosphatase